MRLEQRRVALIGGVAAALIGHGAAAGCSASPSSGATSSDAASDGGDAVVEARPDARFDGDREPYRPAEVPADWVRYDGVSKRCGHYLPSSPAALPPPITWAPCKVDAGASCMQMVAPPNQKFELWSAGTRLSDGRVILAFDRDEGSLHYRMIAEADGPVRFALLATDDGICPTGAQQVYRDKFVYAARFEAKRAFLLGELGALAPSFVARLEPELAHDLYPAPFGLVDLSTDHAYRLYRWPDAAFVTEVAPADGYQNSEPTVTDGAFFWTSSNGTDTKIRVYTPDAGARDFVRSGVLAVGDGNLGTDGRDMVWLRATGRTRPGPFYSSLEIYVAPFTTDPSALVARRLRSEQGEGLGVRKFTVGCGYAARNTGIHLRIVRLSDGDSWKLPASAGWGRPLAITCDEIFVSAWFENAFTIARVRLDSLGPPIPAAD